jgi:hypothetical protein
MPTGPARSGRPDDRLRVVEGVQRGGLPHRRRPFYRATSGNRGRINEAEEAVIVSCPAYVPGIVLGPSKFKTWMTGTSPAMTRR